jgi:hypothetical protein
MRCILPAGVRSPIQWGTEARLEELFGDDVQDIRTERRHLVFRYRSPEAYLDYWRRYYGPTRTVFDAVGEAGRDALENDLLGLVARHNRASDGTMIVESEYLEAVLTRR